MAFDSTDDSAAPPPLAPPAGKKPATVARQAGVMGAATLLYRIGGLLREQVFAFLFGASDVADAFNIAFRIPNLLRDLFAEGAMSAAFVPNFTRALARSKEAALKLLMAVLWTLLLGLTLLSIVGAYYAPELVGLYASGFKAIGWKYDLTVSLTRVMFPFFPLVAMAAACMGALNAMGFFFLPAFAPALFNVASILSGLILCPLLAKFTTIHPIYGMAYGVVLGGFLQFYAQWWKLRKEGLRISTHGAGIPLATPWRAPGVMAIMVLLVPGTVGLAATQLGILINSVYATGKGTGAVSWLNYAFRLMQFPIGIFGVSLAAATLPRVVRALDGNREEAGKQIASSLRLCFAVNFAASAGLMGVGLPVVQMIFQHGRFGAMDSAQTAQALFWYALGLPGYSTVKILVPVYYALGTTRIPLMALNLALNHFFLDVMNYPFWALALATSVTATLNALWLFAWLGRKLPGLASMRLLRGTVLYLALGVLVWCVCWASTAAIDGALIVLVRDAGLSLRALLENHFPIWCAKVFLAMAASGSVWLGVGRLLKLAEMRQATDLIARKLGRRRG